VEIIKYLLIISIAFLILLCTAYAVVYGTPWGKHFMKKETLNYLEHKFTENMVIDEVGYDFDNSNYFHQRYFVIAHPKNNDNIRFKIKKDKDGSTLFDDYFVKYWEYEVNSEINNFLKKLYIENASASIMIPFNPVYNQYEHVTENVPNFHEIKQLMQKELDLYVTIEKKFDEQQNDYEKILEIIEFLKNKSYNLYKVHFNFHGTGLNQKSFNIYGKNFNEINNFDEIKRYVN
jgi:hypothetical protein